MSNSGEDRLQSVWKSQHIVAVHITADEMRKNAVRFERQTRRRNVTDFASFALVLLFIFVGIGILEGALARVGAFLLGLWAIVGLYSVRRFNNLTAGPSTDCSPVSFAAWYQLQLERQRDAALSRPLGLALAVPGMALLLTGYVVDHGTPWAVSAIISGIGMFMGIAAVIHGQILAGRWQEEIDSLQTLRNT